MNGLEGSDNNKELLKRVEHSVAGTIVHPHQFVDLRWVVEQMMVVSWEGRDWRGLLEAVTGETGDRGRKWNGGKPTIGWV